MKTVAARGTEEVVGQARAILWTFLDDLLRPLLPIYRKAIL
jgi:hypothetical protein